MKTKGTKEMDKQIFTYRYSGVKSREIERIREKYLPSEESDLDKLKRLDRRVQNAGVPTGLAVGVVGCLLFGVGLCAALGVLPGALLLGVPLGVIGTGIMLLAYPAYKRAVGKIKAELVPEILRLSEKLLTGESAEN